MKRSELAFFVVFGLVMTFIVSMNLRDWLHKRRLTRCMGERLQRDDHHFGALFSNPKRADIAIRTRQVLSKNLKMPLGGLAPNDRLEEDLKAELPANPHLFWELEAEFGIKSDLEDLQALEKTLERLVTFQDLVYYVEERIAAS